MDEEMRKRAEELDPALRDAIAEEAVRQYAIREKISKDLETIANYQSRLKQKKKHYTKAAAAISAGGRKNRALAFGECCLQAAEELDKMGREMKLHGIDLLPGSLSWILMEKNTKDENGRNCYQYTVAWHVLADEPAIPEEDIRKEIEETTDRIRKETAEMFGLTEDELRKMIEEIAEEEPEEETEPEA